MSLLLGEVIPDFDDFAKRGAKVAALSVDSVADHVEWLKDVEETQCVKVDYPVIADVDRKVSDLYGMIHPKADASQTVRSVFVIDDKKILRASFTYPPSTGRNFDEILRLIDSLQLTDKYKVATPVDWKDGDDVIIVPSLTDPDEIARRFPKGYSAIKPYLRVTAQPNK